MMSEQAETGLRIADGLVVIVLGVLSVVLFWTLPFDSWLRVLGSLVAVLVVQAGFLVLAGHSRGDRLRLTHRRWKYAAALAVITASGIVTAISSPDSLALFLPVTGGFLAQLFESEGSQNFQASSLSSRDAGIWKRIMTGLAIAGTLASLQAITSAAFGAYYLTVVMAPLAVFSLASAGAIWAMLRARKKQLEDTP